MQGRCLIIKNSHGAGYPSLWRPALDARILRYNGLGAAAAGTESGRDRGARQ